MPSPTPSLVAESKRFIGENSSVHSDSLPSKECYLLQLWADLRKPLWGHKMSPLKFSGTCPRKQNWIQVKERWVLWDEAILPKFVGASQDESQTSPVTGWILQKGDTEVEVMQKVYCRVNTFERKKGETGMIGPRGILSISHVDLAKPLLAHLGALSRVHFESHVGWK